MHFELTAGQLHDISSVSQTIKHIPPKTVFIADKAFDCNCLIDSLIVKDMQVVIPSKKNRITPRTHDKEIYKERHLIAIFFGKLKQFRRIAFRVDKLAKPFYLLSIL